MLTGEFLVEKNLITQDVLDKAIEIQTKKRVPIGTVAVENKFINEKELIQILRALRAYNEGTTNKDKPKRFGDISLELGILDSDELFEIKRIQDSTTPLLGNVLRDMGAISSREFVKAMKEFKNLNVK